MFEKLITKVLLLLTLMMSISPPAYCHSHDLALHQKNPHSLNLVDTRNSSCAIETRTDLNDRLPQLCHCGRDLNVPHDQLHWHLTIGMWEVTLPVPDSDSEETLSFHHIPVKTVLNQLLIVSITEGMQSTDQLDDSLQLHLKWLLVSGDTELIRIESGILCPSDMSERSNITATELESRMTILRC
jgi:hypothetical protein